VALDRPVVSVFGPTDPIWIGPYRRTDAVLQANLACSPCYLRQLSRCPNDHRCMTEIPATAVIERIEVVMRGRPEKIETAHARVKSASVAP
jgi:heptosyltransferase-2